LSQRFAEPQNRPAFPRPQKMPLSPLQPVLRPMTVKGFVILPKRWIVERTFAWINKFRHNSKDYERNTESSKAIIYIAMTRMLNMIENDS